MKRFLCPVLAVYLLSGCLYTTHHFNSGRILEPGETAVALGLGLTSIYGVECSDDKAYYYTDSTGAHCRQDIYNSNGQSNDSVLSNPVLMVMKSPKVSLGYRLGVRGAWGPFTGVELGWQLEAPTNPMSVEFDVKFGLPYFGLPAFRHSLSAGWIVGMWADNSWFLEYAGSHSFRVNAIYGNYRMTRLATQPLDLEASLEKWHFQSRTQIVHQAVLGFYWKMPAIVLLPDYLAPQAIATFPVVASFEPVPKSLLNPYQWEINVAFGWNFK